MKSQRAENRASLDDVRWRVEQLLEALLVDFAGAETEDCRDLYEVLKPMAHDPTSPLCERAARFRQALAVYIMTPPEENRSVGALHLESDLFIAELAR